MHLRVLGEVAERGALPVAAVVGEGERALVEHAQEAGRPAAMLDVRLAGGVRGREEEADLLGDEGSHVALDPRPPPVSRFHAGIRLARSLAGLDGLHGVGECGVAGVIASRMRLAQRCNNDRSSRFTIA